MIEPLPLQCIGLLLTHDICSFGMVTISTKSVQYGSIHFVCSSHKGSDASAGTCRNVLCKVGSSDD